AQNRSCRSTLFTMTTIWQPDSLVRVTGMEPARDRASRFGLRIIVILIAFVGSIDVAFSQQLQQARVTQVVNDVKLLPNLAAPRPATVNDEVMQDTAVRTGTDSRTELTFKDLTITRLG